MDIYPANYPPSIKTQKSEQPQTQVATNSDIQPSGYPDIQLPEQPDTQTVGHLSSQLSTFMKTQKSEQPQTQLPKKPDTQPSGYPSCDMIFASFTRGDYANHLS
ncbi:hypothetical protein HCG51_34460 (plasmid) [Tolypothrix sp. PCC 7910]|uniref:hypothetical protein n=1 Tax=Tolypothrix sp. PCC 7910 TaxID=2099387 RepID=UPI00142797A7|nr:hypothetical protein [Tolypothrix sp. PCC 7910]QIR41796.1 hypothetical protein HCG51_34460 [Tolypothrix sp. PCC 7910]